jgi:hypothetical protein
MRSLFLTLAIVGILGCAHDQCNNVPQRPADPTSPAASPGAGLAGAQPTPPTDAVQVQKPTGEKQCGMGRGTSLGEMQLLLSENGIVSYESHTQSDGLMHTALCGSPAGTIHVFSIPKADLAKAKKLGFKLLK